MTCVLCGRPGVALTLVGAVTVTVCAVCAPAMLQTLSDASGLDFSQLLPAPDHET